MSPVRSRFGTSWPEPSTPGPDLADILLGIAARSSSDVWTVGGRASLIHPRTRCLTSGPASWL